MLSPLGDLVSGLKASDWIAIVAGLITLAGVVVVFLQLHSLNQQTRLQNFGEYTRRYQQIVLNFPEDINARSFSLAGRKDHAEIMRYMRAYYDLCFEEWYLHRKGLIEDDFWNVWLDGIRTSVSKPAFQQAWKVMQADTNYGPHFSGFIQQLIDTLSTRSA
jgi:hypothetical protein